MRAVVLTGGALVLEEVPDPAPAAGQVLVRTLVNGICGSDLHSLERASAGPPYPDPVVLGHEFCAEVVDYGPGTEERPFGVGSLVCANPFTQPSGPSGQGGGGNGGVLVNPGGLAEYMVLDVDRTFAVPAGLEAGQAALTEPLAVGIRAVSVGESLPGQGPYIVNGCGPIGLSVITALRALGRGPIVATDLSPIRLAVAERLGVDLAINAAEDSAWDHLAEFGFADAGMSPRLPRRAGTGLGLTIYECSGANGMLPRLMAAAPSHSSIVVAGIALEPDLIAPSSGIMKELTIGYALAYRQEELELALRRIGDGVVDTEAFVTATVPLAETPWAFDALHRAEHVKILIQPDR